MSAPIVIDSSVAVKWFVVEPHTVKARAILDQFRLGGLSFLAPDLIYAEFGNVIWKKQRFPGAPGPGCPGNPRCVPEARDCADAHACPPQ